LVIVHVGLGASSVVEMSTTCDEIAHLTAGYSHYRTGDFRMVPEHPPLAHLWAALPLNFMKVKFPSLDQPSWWAANQWEFGADWFYKAGNDPQRLLLAGRVMILLLSAALGLAVFRWSRRLFGDTGGLISLALYAFCPTLLANGSAITTDLAAGLFFLLATGTVWTALHRVTPATIGLAGLALGGLALSKMSFVLILPVYALLLLVRTLSRAPLPICIRRRREIASRGGRLAIHATVLAPQGLIVVGMIWAAFGFRYEAMPEAVAGRDRLPVTVPGLPEGIESWDHILQRAGAFGQAMEWVRDQRLLPEAYAYGFTFAIVMTRAASSFLNGECSVDGFVSFFPYCFLYKTTLPCLVLLALAAWILAGRPRRGDRAAPDIPLRMGYELAPLLILVAVYVASAIASGFNIGHRHLLPIYPPLFILAGAAARLHAGPPGPIRWAVPGLLALHAAASTSVWPHYLAFFNVVAGGPANGYRRLVDSSLDWGQELLRLKQWIDRKAAGATIHLSYLGNGSPEYYGIRAVGLPTFPAQPLETTLVPWREGCYCISATNLPLVHVFPVSRWTSQLERDYQRCIGRVRRLQGEAAATAADGTPDELVGLLRFARLCAFLRLREPDDHVGYSILIYRLTSEQVRAALFGPPPEEAADDAESLLNIGDLYAERGSPAIAEEHYRAALRLEPHQAKAHHNLGVVLGQMARAGEGIAHLREAVKLDPTFAEAHENLGNALAVAGRPLEAIPCYEAAVRLRPSTPEPYASLADLYATQDRLEEAVSWYGRLIDRWPRWPDPHASRASVRARMGDFARAVADYREALRLRPGWPAMHNNLGLVLASQGSLEEAAASFAEAVRLAPESVSGHCNLATVRLQQGRIDDAVAGFEAALRLDPASAQAREGLQRARRPPGAGSRPADLMGS
jgi:tetratricopeptide (TPR) repeat protein